ncbi:MFS general substrate transporter [Linderina pennispora]|uniref:MFS general substrate transporter n=1 Tax=Linderina pennispora TaxID=61395 RepID=A0A1Y1WB98_9FUNG|nr:MFS general substrate transporter [Linderina pennispora]ORX70598.1 MFS general substrate transporter [Linderina pennispora]
MIFIFCVNIPVTQPCLSSTSTVASAGKLSNQHPSSASLDSYGHDAGYINKGYNSWQAWLVVLAGGVLAMITLGASRAHGVFQEYYIIDEFPNASTADISWIGSVQNMCLNLCGVAVGILSQIYDTRILCAAGAATMGLSFIVASFCTELWQLVLAQGFAYGCAASFPYILGVTVPMQWIEKRRGLAVGIVYMGSGVGGIWISVLTRTCIEALGRDWANRILGIIMIVVGVALSPLMLARRPKQRPKKLLDLSVVKESRFLLIAAASFFSMGPNTVPFLMMPTYVTKVLEESIFGRLIAGFLSDRYGPINILVIWTALAAFSQLGLWLPFKNVPALIAAAALFGVTGSSIIGMLLNALSHMFGVARITYISGLVYMTYSIASLATAQSASLMLDTVGHGTDYTWAILYTGMLLVISTVILVALRLKLSTKLLFFA